MGPATTTLSTAMGCRTAETALTSPTAVSEADRLIKGLFGRNSFAAICCHWNWFITVTTWISIVNFAICSSY